MVSEVCSDTCMPYVALSKIDTDFYLPGTLSGGASHWPLISLLCSGLPNPCSTPTYFTHISTYSLVFCFELPISNQGFFYQILSLPSSQTHLPCDLTIPPATWMSSSPEGSVSSQCLLPNPANLPFSPHSCDATLSSAPSCPDC
ncbi:hypothetical protein HJG60_011532 [Phyllostomus discolor]|uniref:Uncharacterized protein n=1 Tax=Phyllostomus discolor TaxID=89673 RepID=A0A833ZY78_9CHIR|nr:hypothetical protein HJG60_011532 [Phyllostomus discolor]